MYKKGMIRVNDFKYWYIIEFVIIFGYRLVLGVCKMYNKIKNYYEMK